MKTLFGCLKVEGRKTLTIEEHIEEHYFSVRSVVKKL